MKSLLRMFDRGPVAPPRAEIIKVHVSRVFPDPKKPSPSLLYTDWQNTGTVPIRLVVGTITTYNAAGAVVSEIQNATIYQAADSTPGVPPGAMYQGKKEEGIMGVEGVGQGQGGGPIVSADAVITLVTHKSGIK